MQPTLVVREACEHNLRAVSLDLPHESLVAVPVRIGLRRPQPIRIGLRCQEDSKQGEGSDHKGHRGDFLLLQGQKRSVAEAERPPLRVGAKPKEMRRA